METWHLAALLRPVLYIVLYVTVIYWLLKLAAKWIPEGRIKQFLFKRWSEIKQAHRRG